MSRVANNPISLPAGVEAAIEGGTVTVKGTKGTMSLDIHPIVEITRDDGKLRFAPRNRSRAANAMAGTMRSVVNGMVVGVSQGFERRLELRGVGYRAQIQGQVLNLTVGLSHPVNFAVPEGVTIETPGPTEIVVKGINKQQVGQVAAVIRASRPPEPYKGKGIRYADEQLVLKEAKKK
ncbi:MAG: 50S ribosomal protein L6 [Gammaproteobacteria bacterium]|nr:50S ribosomal protein L6 [Gammaproteobacteria bacterium]NIR98755.1 50S ribosomal protein L6 [Gammaproteobacteria bacterium]NIT64465.1 50S ribosomal protein L6 [Gammaproteobacteria bacterium]NIV21385.1 50S ribosomal protein L6 [Gammaproteobacteria bacterium]NIX11255.1 50S ribosomal protein L6 [Gammaproteobacteria bacterium]